MSELNHYIGALATNLIEFETPCGTGTMTHPSVVHAPAGFADYEYWMAATPYDGEDNTIENPCVFASHDGNQWTVPDGAVNPLVPSPIGNAYNSDPDLVLHKDVLHLWYRRTDDGFDTILHSSSRDGRHWSEFDVALQIPQDLERILSPAVVSGGDDRWFMYTVRFVQEVNLKVVQRRDALSPEGPWSPPVDCAVQLPEGRLPWHIDIRRSGDKYWMIVADSTTNKGGDLFFLSSSDGITFDSAQNPLLSRQTGLGSGLYRSAFVPRLVSGDEDSSDVVADVWYAIVDGSKWGIARGIIRYVPEA